MRELDPVTFFVAEALFENRSPADQSSPPTDSPLSSSNHTLAPKSECLVLLAHGSKDPRWRAPFEQLAQRLRQELGDQNVRLAYMEFIAPTLMDVASECVGQQIVRLKVLPLFMAVGAHIAKDIPEQAAAAQRQFPQLTIEVLPPIGEDVRLLQLVEQLALEAAKR
jgi:sirohydrochlorin cobaltochelatase